MSKSERVVYFRSLTLREKVKYKYATYLNGSEPVEVHTNEVNSFKRIKKLDEMSFMETLKESLFMYFFGDSIANQFASELGYYLHYKKEHTGVSAYAMILERKLLEKQRLLEKYNHEELILGLELVEKGTKDYQELIKPYKVEAVDGKSRLFTKIFKPAW